MISLAILVSHGYAADDPNNPSVLSVNGYPVHQREFCWFMQQERAAVFQMFCTTDHPDSEKNFWDQDCDGTTPKEVLEKRTTEKIIREKVQQILFKELGLIQDIRYAAFLENFEKVNHERQTAVEQGRVIYGPVQYTILQYYGHWMATMQIQAKDKLRKEQLDVTEPKTRDYYRRNKEQFRTAESLTLEMLVIRRPQTADSQRSRKETESLVDAITSKVQQGQRLETVVGEYKDRKSAEVLLHRYEHIQSDRLSELFPDNKQFNRIGSMEPGQVIQLPRAENEIWIVKCVSITPADYLPYEQIESRVADRYIDAEYDRLIQMRVQNAQVEINRKVIDRIKILHIN